MDFQGYRAADIGGVRAVQQPPVNRLGKPDCLADRNRQGGVVCRLRLPGHGDSGPTLEIFQYAENAERLPPAANREGIGHLAFEVDDVAEAMAEVMANGGRKIGEITSFEVESIGMISFVYIADPEGNMIELQAFG